jgi:hypothetical protein
LHKAWSISPAARAGSDREENQIETRIETDAGCERLKGVFRHNHVRFPIRNVPNNSKQHHTQALFVERACRKFLAWHGSRDPCGFAGQSPGNMAKVWPRFLMKAEDEFTLPVFDRPMDESESPMTYAKTVDALEEIIQSLRLLADHLSSLSS